MATRRLVSEGDRELENYPLEPPTDSPPPRPAESAAAAQLKNHPCEGMPSSPSKRPAAATDPVFPVCFGGVKKIP